MWHTFLGLLMAETADNYGLRISATNESYTCCLWHTFLSLLMVETADNYGLRISATNESYQRVPMLA
jgi:hypothetical protein